MGKFSCSWFHFSVDTQDNYGTMRKIDEITKSKAQLSQRNREKTHEDECKISFKENCLNQLRGPRTIKRRKTEWKSSIDIGYIYNKVSREKSKLII